MTLTKFTKKVYKKYILLDCDHSPEMKKRDFISFATSK